MTVVKYKKQIHATELINPSIFDRVQENNLVASVFIRFHLGFEASRIVSAALGSTGPTRPGAIDVV